MEQPILYVVFCLLTFALLVWGTVLSGDDVTLAGFMAMLVLSFMPVINVILLAVAILLIFDKIDKIIVFKGRK